MANQRKTRVVVHHRARLIPLWDDGDPIREDDGSPLEIQVDTFQTHPLPRFRRGELTDTVFAHVAERIAINKARHDHGKVQEFQVAGVEQVSRRII